MTADQRIRVRDVFEAALEAGRSDREWIAEQANEDLIVADEVMSLLAHHERAGTFLTHPAMENLGGIVAEEQIFSAGQKVGEYVVSREIGRGGMGRVYLATDTRLGRQVALKVLDGTLAGSPSQRQRLRREARAAAQLSHPGICTVYALEELDGEIIIAVEYVDGVSLRTEIESGNRPSIDQVERTLRQLASALAAAHARGITHRDLKPENVMRVKDGSVKILDFGLALVDEKLAGTDTPRVTVPGAVVGTPAYMAPEQINGAAVDARTDLFALGVLIFEYATGVHPFHAPTAVATWARVLEGRPTELAGLRSDLPANVSAAVGRCLERDPGRRFASAADLLAALKERATRTPASDSVRWWRIHMMTVIGLYAMAVFSVWVMSSTMQMALVTAGFLITAILATVGGIWRGHLLFAERTHERARAVRELRRAVPILTAVDLAIATVLLISGVRLAATRPVLGTLVAALGISVALARLVLERVTTEAAFESHDH